MVITQSDMKLKLRLDTLVLGSCFLLKNSRSKIISTGPEISLFKTKFFSSSIKFASENYRNGVLRWSNLKEVVVESSNCKVSTLRQEESIDFFVDAFCVDTGLIGVGL